VDQLHALGLTLACEVPVVTLLARTRPVSQVLIVAIGASCLTHPLAWRIASVLSPDEYRSGLWLIEIGVVLVEAMWYRFWLCARFGLALRWSLLANAMSFGAGWLLLSS
jgi:hypothetical protein